MFKGHLREFIPSITTAQQALEVKKVIKKHHKGTITEWEAELSHLPVAHINISFAQRGLEKVSKPC